MSLYRVTTHEIVTNEIEVLAVDMDEAKRKALMLVDLGIPGVDFIRSTGGHEHVTVRELTDLSD